MRKPLLHSLGLFFLLNFLGYAQENEVSGVVMNQEKQPLSYVNILLLKTEDSTMIKGVTTLDDGRFSFGGVTAGEYLVKSSYIGYQTDFRAVSVSGATDAGTIFLKPATQDLQGVTVSFKRPTIEKKPDRLIFNVANTNLSTLSGLEIIKSTPGVIVINNEIRVKNSRPVIYLNEKRVYLSDNELSSLLQGYSGANVEKVEVITNPPARYDADGSVVLNIVTKGNVSIGYKGALEGRGDYAIFPKYNFATQHFYKTDVLDFFFNYNFNRSKLNKNDDSYVNYFDEGTGAESWETAFNRITRKNDHQVNTILDFKTGAQSSLNFSANLFWSPDKRFNNTATTVISPPGGPASSSFDTESFLENDTYNYVFGAEYTTALGENGTDLSAGANYIYYQQDQLQELNTVFYDANGDFADANFFDTEGRQKNNILTARTDLSTPALGGTFSTGLKFTNTKSQSGVAFSGFALPEGTADDSFEYTEDIYAAYVDYTASWDEWDLQLGTRVEQTDVAANSQLLGDVNTQEYFAIFPKFNLQFTPSEDHSYGLSYGRSITRPDYQRLNPFRYYIIENNYEEGNPLLTRSLEDKITMSYTFKQQYSLELGYLYSDGALDLLPFQDNLNKQYYQTQYNMDHYLQYSLDLFLPVSITPRWYAQAYTSAFYMENQFPAVESPQGSVTMSTTGFYGQLYQSVTLGKNRDLNLDAIYVYMSDFYAGSWKMENQHTLILSLRKELWDNRAVITMGVEDVLNKTNMPMRSAYLNQDNGFFARPETRKFYVTFRYNFGNFRLQDNERNTDPAELERLKLDEER